MRRRYDPCPLCGGQGTTHLRTAGGQPQRCGICRGTGLVPRPERPRVPWRFRLSGGRWWFRLRLGPLVLGGGWLGSDFTVIVRRADPVEN